MINKIKINLWTILKKSSLSVARTITKSVESQSSPTDNNFLQTGAMPLREKCPNTELFLVRIFPHSENGGKYGPEITSYLDTFHALRLDAQSLRYHSNVRLKTCYLTLFEFFFRKTLKGKHCFALEAHLNLSKYFQLFYKLRNSWKEFHRFQKFRNLSKYFHHFCKFSLFLKPNFEICKTIFTVFKNVGIQEISG